MDIWPVHYATSVQIHEDAVLTFKEEVSIRCILAETDPTSNKYLAKSLNNLGVQLLYDDAAPAKQEAASLFCKFAVDKSLADSPCSLDIDFQCRPQRSYSMH